MGFTKGLKIPFGYLICLSPAQIHTWLGQRINIVLSIRRTNTIKKY